MRIPISLACWAWSVWGELPDLPTLERSQADNLSIDELLHGYPITRITDLPCRLPDVPLLLRPSLDDHDTMTDISGSCILLHWVLDHAMCRLTDIYDHSENLQTYIQGAPLTPLTSPSILPARRSGPAYGT